MDPSAQDIQIAPTGDGGSRSSNGQGGQGLADSDLDAARELAELHRLIAAEMAPQSQLRGLVLRCAGHWSRLGGLPRNGLTKVHR